jgi:hypothetical protein
MKALFVCLVLLFGLGSTVCMAADDVRNPYLYERFTLKGGIMHHTATGEFSSKKDGKKKVEVDLDDLGLDEKEYTPYVSARLRLSKRLSLDSGYFGYHESGKNRNEFDFDIGDITIPVNAITDSENNLDVIYVNLGYSVYSSENTEVGLGIGVHGADFSLQIAAETESVGQLPPVSIGEETEDILAPLPNLYFFASRAIRDNLLLHLNGGWMSLSYDDYDGDLFFVRSTLEYRLKEHFGIGGGYSYYDFKVDYDPGGKVETYDVQFHGPVVYLIVGF